MKFKYFCKLKSKEIVISAILQMLIIVYVVWSYNNPTNLMYHSIIGGIIFVIVIPLGFIFGWMLYNSEMEDETNEQ